MGEASCNVCPHACSPAEGAYGLCGSRKMQGGKIVPEGYGRLTSLALDPIEKKPFARFHPGTTVLSLSSYGCNLKCPWCQNHMISYATANTTDWRQMSPREVVDRALKLKRRGCIGIAYTYNEPFINLEFMRDCGELAHENGLVNVVVSNGMVSWSALESVAHLIDAANIDLKGFSRKFYDDICGSYECVMSTIETLATLQSCHLEVTTLVIPGLNDSPEGIDAAAQWLASLSDEIPYHVTRFFPSFKYGNRQPTPIETVYVLAEVARKHLRYVFTGNC